MRKPDGVIEIFLQPGELYFGDRYTRLRTVLGSCVSLVFWHPKAVVGGMCHYMLPTRRHRTEGELDGRYGDEAIALMMAEARQAGVDPRECKVRVYGGGDMFPQLKTQGRPGVGQQNVEAARTLVRAHQLQCVAAHVEGIGHRSLIFDIWSGYVHLRQANGAADAQAGFAS